MPLTIGNTQNDGPIFFYEQFSCLKQFLQICKETNNFHENFAKKTWKKLKPLKKEVKRRNWIIGSSFIAKKLLELLIFIIVYDLTESNLKTALVVYHMPAKLNSVG